MAAEFAYIFSMFGSDVSIISRSTFLKNTDRHLRSLAIKELEGVEIYENTCVQSISGRSRIHSVCVRTGGKEESIDSDTALIAAGLVPRSEMLNGVKKGSLGEVIVDNRMQTSVPGVYACGDVTGPPYLTPVARYQGIIAADNILKKPRTIDMQYIPQSINLGYELAFCTSETKGAGSVTIPGPAGPGTFWSVPRGDTGLSKVLFDPDNGDIRGIVTAGPGGGLIAGYMAFLMKRHFSVHDFDEFIEVHPSTDGIYSLLKYTSDILNKHPKN